MTTEDLEKYRLDQFTEQLNAAAAPLYAARAATINAARTEGLTWRKIASILDMAEVSVQRAPGVDSPWNARLAATTPTEGDQQ